MEQYEDGEGRKVQEEKKQSWRESYSNSHERNSLEGSFEAMSRWESAVAPPPMLLQLRMPALIMCPKHETKTGIRRQKSVAMKLWQKLANIVPKALLVHVEQYLPKCGNEPSRSATRLLGGSLAETTSVTHDLFAFGWLFPLERMSLLRCRSGNTATPVPEKHCGAVRELSPCMRERHSMGAELGMKGR
ncbi:unnamed protein product [Cylicostephanus goldi]|uniref:Uncharacterized protein n=1 Tax=Cylicostephanus goldi TaxID=71465 RepID=A0A3P6T2V8_CYLGO|nr:unnamed protein product [Cylicostephanus goldi]